MRGRPWTDAEREVVQRLAADEIYDALPDLVRILRRSPDSIRAQYRRMGM